MNITPHLKTISIAIFVGLSCVTSPAFADNLRPNPEVGFSPEGDARNLVIQFVQESKSTLDIMAYKWTAGDITRAIEEAAARGVRVRLVADYIANVEEDKYGASRRALSRLAAAGVEVRVNRQYPILHDKSMLSDGLNVQTGSFNYTRQAEEQNSEQVFVFRNAPHTFRTLSEHFNSRFEAAEIYR